LVELAKARYADQDVADRPWEDIISMTKADPEVLKDYVGILDNTFEQIETIANPRSWWRRDVLTQTEAKAIAQARIATFDWLMSNLGRKSHPTTAEVIAKAREFAIIYRLPRTAALYERQKELGLDESDIAAVMRARQRGVSEERIMEIVEEGKK